jgi:hypothetical protein
LRERSDPFFQPALFDNALENVSADIMQEQWLNKVRRAAENQVLDFNDLSRRLTALQGQKHVVLLSEGFDAGGAYDPAKSAAAVRNASFDLGPNGLPEVGSTFAEGGAVGGIMGRRIMEMHRAFQASDIVLHTVDLKGVSTLMGNDALSALAGGTGGKFVHNRNDLSNALVELSSTYSQSYVLGFRPVGARRNHNSISVKLRNASRGTTVSYRKGFDATPDPIDVNEGLYRADVVLNDVPQSGTAAALTMRSGAVEVRLPMAQLAAQAGKDGKAELLVYSFAANGTALGFHRQVIDVASNASGEKTIEVALPAGTTVAKALLAINGSLGFSKISL